MADSKRGFRGNSLENKSFRGISDENDLRPTVLKRESSAFSPFSQPDVYRSYSTDSSDLGSDGLHPTPIYRSVTHDETFPSSITSDIIPRPKLGASKTSPFSTSHPSTIDGGVLSLMHSPALYKDLPKEPPPVPGGYLEPSYHFISRSKPSSLLDAIPKALVSLMNKKEIMYGIDFDINPQKYKVKCVAYPLGEPKLPFVVSVFLMDPDDKGKRYALEFQRRSGDVIQFSDIWAKSKRYFQENGFHTEKCSVRSSKKLPLPLEVPIAESQIRDTLKCLLQMASSSCHDVKSQAVAALSKMSTEEQHQALMLEEEGCLETFIAAVTYPVEDVHRCAVSALANLAHNRLHVCEKIAERNGIKLLCALSKSCTKEIVRECLRALLCITRSLHCDVDDNLQRTIESHRDSRDPFTQLAVQELQKLQL